MTSNTNRFSHLARVEDLTQIEAQGPDRFNHLIRNEDLSTLGIQAPEKSNKINATKESVVRIRPKG